MSNNDNFWRTVKLQEITTKIGSGATPRGGKEAYKKNGITLIRSLNVYDFRFDYDGLAFIDDEQARELLNVEVKPYDILLNITGASVARCCMVPQQLLPARVNQHVAIVRCKPSIANPYFVLYTINSPQYKGRLLSLAQGGATREALTKETIGNFEIVLPPLPIQQATAGILSAYDNLIVNNERRIAILEEMAQMLYEEWFVKFRFPGHEHVKMVESEMGMIPEGCGVVSFAEVADFINGFAFKPHHWRRAGKPIIKIAELKNGITDKTPYFEGDNIPLKYHIQNGDLLFSWSADLDVYIWKQGPAFLNQHLFNVIPFKQFTKIFVFFSLKERMDEFRIRSQGTTMRHIKRSALDEVRLLVPPYEQRKLFEYNAEPILLAVQNLVSKNTSLRQTRDKLLPKLISGEIDVSSWGGRDERELAQELAVVGGSGAYEQGRTTHRVTEAGPVEPIEKDELEWRSLWE